MSILLEMISDLIVTGVVVSRFEAKNRDCYIEEEKVLTLRCINCGVINRNEIDQIKVEKQIDSSKLTQAGDIILKMNKPYDAVYIERDFEGLVIPSFCCRIANVKTERIDPYYLVGYLNSSFAREFLMTANGASAASLLKIKDIKKLPVYMPPLEQQKAIGKIFKIACERQLILNELMHQEMTIAENILLDVVGELIKDGY